MLDSRAVLKSPGSGLKMMVRHAIRVVTRLMSADEDLGA